MVNTYGARAGARAMAHPPLRHRRGLPWASGFGPRGRCVVYVLSRLDGTGGSRGRLGHAYEVVYAHPQDTRNRRNRPHARLLPLPFANPLDRLDWDASVLGKGVDAFLLAM